jgi:two-component system cell cycle sensor histidine kinase/response regulator CckA
MSKERQGAEVLPPLVAAGELSSADLRPEDRGWRIVLMLGAIAVAVSASLCYALVHSGVTSAVLAWAAALAVIIPGSVFLFVLHRVLRFRSAERYSLDIIQGAYETLRAPRAIIDPHGRLVYANSTFHRMFGAEGQASLVAMEQQLASDPAARDQLETLKRVARQGSAAQAEIQVKTPDGRVEWRNIEATPLPGFPRSVVLRIDDTTSRREMEQIIREEQEKLVDFLENAPVGFYSVDDEGRFLFVNHTLAEWLQSTPEDIMSRGARLHDFVVGDARKQGPAYDPFGGDGRDHNGEIALRGVQGRAFQAYVSQSIVNSERGGLRTRSVVRDLSPEREWEVALRRSERRFERIFEDAPVGIALLDLDGRITECNRAFRRLFSDEAKDPEGGELLELVAGEGRRHVETALGKVVAGDSFSGPVEIHPEGHPEWGVSVYMSRVEDDAGKVTGVILHGLDMTQQRRLEIQFAQSQKMQAVGQLAGGVAHDFNNLLTAMIGFCDLLLLRHKAGEQSFADIMQIKQNANRAASLVRQLLAFSRQQTLKPKVLNVTDVLAELAHLLRRLVGDTIELEMTHGRDLGLVRVDQGQLEQVIINLVVNARDAMPKGGKVTIKTSNVASADPIRQGHEMLPAGAYVLVEVIDRGIGISKENLGRIFEPFFSTKEVGSGTGLGLSTVYGIIKQTGGYIFVESAPGQGATFRVFLPRHHVEAAEAVAVSTARSERPQDLTGAGTILLVEDEDAVRMFSARALRNKGYVVLEAKSGESALEVLNNDKTEVDLLITDVVMPKMDGPALIREVREQRPDIRIICISGYAEDAFRKKLDSSADIHFLPKPFSLNQLAGKVKEVMAPAPAPTAH